MAKSSGGIRTVNLKSFSAFVNIVKQSKTFSEAFGKASTVRGVSSRVADRFFKAFGDNKNSSPRQAFQKFYNTIKK